MMSGILAGSENRIRRIQFKEAVELAKLSHILAAQSEIDDETLRRLHVRCVEEVKRTNGVITGHKLSVWSASGKGRSRMLTGAS